MITPGARQTATAALRLRVVETALTLFNDHGYGAVSIEKICAASGVSVGSLYHHFASKAGIAAAVYGDAIRRYHETLIAVVEEQPDAESGIRSLVEQHHHWVAANGAWARFLVTGGEIAEVRASTADHDAANERLAAALLGWAQPLMDRGDLMSLEPALFLSVVFGPSYFHTRASLRGSPDPPEPDVAVHLAAAAWRSLDGTKTQSSRTSTTST